MQREAQAKLLRELADDAVDHQKHHVVVSGDLNDWSATVLDRNGHFPISRVLQLLENDAKFQNVALKVNQTHRFTHWWDQNRNKRIEDHELSQLDHLLVSKELFKQIQKVEFYGESPLQCEEQRVSDHFPLAVVFATERTT